MRLILSIIFFITCIPNYAQETPFFGIDSIDDILSKNYAKKPLQDKINRRKVESILDTIIAQNGWFNLGYVDLDAKELYTGNDWEGFRFGVGARTSYKVHSKWEINGRLNYGTKDNAFKYKLGTSYLVNPDKFSKVYTSYQQDIFPIARYGYNLTTFSELLEYRSELSSIADYVDENKWIFGYNTHIAPILTFDLSISTADQRNLFDYKFKDFPANQTYKDHVTHLEVRYAPNEVYKHTKMGKFLAHKDWPVYHVSATKGWDLGDNSQEYVRLNFAGNWSFNWIKHPTFLRLYAGKVFGEVPIWHYFDGGAKDELNANLLSRFIFGGSEIFETMKPGEFISDQYVYALLNQTVFKIRTSPQKFADVQLLYKVAIGNISNKENHRLDFKKMNYPYQEIGLELNKILFNLVGVGIYYRFGTYRTGSFRDDFAVKGTLNL